MLLKPGSQLVFDQIVTDTSGTRFSDPKFNDWLGLGNELSVFVIADRVSGSGALTVGLQDAADLENHWVDSFGADGVEGSTSAVSQSLPTSGLVVNSYDSEEFRGRPALGFRRVGVAIAFDASPGSARVRVWIAARGGYRIFHKLIFSERLEGSGVYYTQPEACAALAGADKLLLTYSAEEISGLTPTLTVMLQESPNGRTWQDAPAGATGVPIDSLPTEAIQLFSDVLPPAGFVRFRLQLNGTSPAATIRLWVTGRETHPA